MRLGLISSFVPHVDGGYRLIVESLAFALQSAGHEAEVVYLPWSGDPDWQLAQMANYRMLDLTRSFDRIVTFRPPSYAVRHRHKIVWFIHHERMFYDLWDSPLNPIEKTASQFSLRKALQRADCLALNEAQLLLCNSEETKRRLKDFNKLEADVLFPPIPHMLANGLRCCGYNDELVYISRVERHKRQHLAVEAMAYTNPSIRLRVCGQSQDRVYVEELRGIIEKLKLESRVTLDLRWISDDEKIALLNSCLAAIYVPFLEDGFGYPTLEAAKAAKCTVTTSDSGAVIEFVKGALSACVAEPDPRALAEVFNMLHSQNQLQAERLGKMSEKRIDELNISWDRVISSVVK